MPNSSDVLHGTIAANAVTEVAVKITDVMLVLEVVVRGTFSIINCSTWNILLLISSRDAVFDSFIADFHMFDEERSAFISDPIRLI